MKTVQEALQNILSHFEPLPAEQISLESALGRVLVGDVYALNDLPPFANSAMDGYAVRAEDLAHVPQRLPVVGDITAGLWPEFTLQSGQAARIMTGAAVPQGANAIVPIEDTDDDGSQADAPPSIEIRQSPKQGAYIRPQGEDVAVGAEVFKAGQRLRPQDIGLLAGLGVAQVAVTQRPKVAILSTGDELLSPDEPLQAGKIRDMNSYSLAAMVAALGAIPLHLGIAKDDPAAVRAKLEAALASGAHLILSSAGVSVGARDVVKSVVASLGGLDFWRVEMRPGKPLAFGHVANVPFCGLPGNPVSSLVTFEVFMRPAILRLMGLDPTVQTVQVIAGEDFYSDGRETYQRVWLRREDDGLRAYSTGTQSSGALSSLVKADALAIIPAGTSAVPIGTPLMARPFADSPL